MNYQKVLERKGIETFGGAGESDFLINCPFHDDQKPSCEVHRYEGIFYCFGCGKSGSFAKLIAEISGVSIGEAKKQLLEADNVDVVVDEINRALDGEKQKKIEYFSVKSFHKIFPKVMGTLGEGYLKTRKLSRNIIERFDLRWGESGVMKERGILPIYTTKGKLLTYAGRAAKDGMQPKSRKARSAGKALYGLYELIREKKGRLPYLIICEGEFDAMWLQQNGWNGVSSMGTAVLTEDQVALIRRHSELAVVSFDGDNAGRRAQKVAVRSLREILPTIEVAMPEGKDPNELSAKNLEVLYGGII